jgi:hypothetical protein
MESCANALVSGKKREMQHRNKLVADASDGIIPSVSQLL